MPGRDAATSQVVPFIVGEDWMTPNVIDIDAADAANPS
jgi:hypothetical protein